MEQDDLNLVKTLKNQQAFMLEQLHEFCEINSSSDNLPGLALMSATLQLAFKPIADEIHIKSLPPVNSINMQGACIQQQSGDALFIRKRPELKRRILLAGHMDTVYPSTSSFQKLRQLNEHEINGPGVTDMKGGLIVLLHALSAFEHSQAAEHVGWDVLINADEEIGSEASNNLFESIASNYQAALVYEPSINKQGDLAKNRKGNGKFTIIATGKKAHAGRAFDEGRNAICYLAEAITAINALNGKRQGVTLNIGKVAGGEALNVVPDKAIAKIDVRISQQEDELWVRQELGRVQMELQKPEYTLSIQGHFGRPVKRVSPACQHLFSRIQKIGASIDLNLNWHDIGGCCDGNNLAQYGLPVIDTLGVRGGNIHSEEEFIIIDSLPERAALSTLILIDLAKGGLEDLSK